MEKTTDGLDSAWLVGAMSVIAIFLYAALSSDHGKLRDEIVTLRVEVRCFAEQEDCDVARLLSELSRRRQARSSAWDWHPGLPL